MEKKEFLLKTIVDCKATITSNDESDDVNYDCSIELEFYMNELMKFLLAQGAKGLYSRGAMTSLDVQNENVMYKINFSLGREI